MPEIRCRPDSALIHSVRVRPSWGGFGLRVDFEVSAMPGRRVQVVASVYDRKGDRLLETGVERIVGDRPLRETCELRVDDHSLRQGLAAGQHYITYAVAVFTLGAGGSRTERARSRAGVWSVSFQH